MKNNMTRNEKQIRTMIEKNLAKEYYPNTKPSVDFIKKILDDAYASGVVMTSLICDYWYLPSQKNEMKFKSPNVENRK